MSFDKIKIGNKIKAIKILDPGSELDDSIEYIPVLGVNGVFQHTNFIIDYLISGINNSIKGTTLLLDIEQDGNGYGGEAEVDILLGSDGNIKTFMSLDTINVINGGSGYDENDKIIISKCKYLGNKQYRSIGFL